MAAKLPALDVQCSSGRQSLPGALLVMAHNQPGIGRTCAFRVCILVRYGVARDRAQWPALCDSAQSAA
eukprot:362322-Chlamydomonas_euryale.AAC.20